MNNDTADLNATLDCGIYADVNNIKWWFDGVLVAIVGLIGFVGNTLALIVLSRPSLRDVFHQLLFALACFDILYIVCGGINYTVWAFKAESDIYTYLFPYFLHPFAHIALAGTIFMTMAISIERYLGLCHPLLNPHSRKAWFYIVPVLVVAIALNIPKFFEITINYGRKTENGTIVDEHIPSLGVSELRITPTYIRGYLTWTRLFSTGLIPVIILLFLNVRIINDIFQSSQKVQRFGSARRQRKEINLSVVLLCIVVVFFCCHAIRIILDVYEFSNIEKVINCKPFHPGHFMHALVYISHFSTILNSSLNFFVYCLIGHTFRRELCRTLGIKGRRGDNFISRRTSGYEGPTMMTAMTTSKKPLVMTSNGGNNGSLNSTANNAGRNHNNHHNNAGEQENLITIEATEDMIKVESHQL